MDNPGDDVTGKDNNANDAESCHEAPEKTSRHILKHVVQITCFLAVCILVWTFVSYMLVPKDGTSYNTKVYDALPDDTVDAIFIGASGFWDGISPLTMWSEAGITSYVFASSNCSPQVAYLMLKEALKKQHPKVMFFSPMYISKYQPTDQVQLRIYQGLTNRKLTLDKIYVSAQITKDVDVRTGIKGLLPLLAYHDNWKNIQEVTFLHRSEGIYMGQRCWSFFNEPYDHTKQDLMDRAQIVERPFEYNELAVKYYREMIALCKAENINVVLLTLPNHLQKIRFEPQRQFAAEQGIDNVNLNDPQYLDILDIDNKTEWRDRFHLNFWGSIKLSKWLGPFIQDRYDMPDRRSLSDPSSKMWSKHYSMFYKDLSWLSPGDLKQPDEILPKG